MINLDYYETMESHWIALSVNAKNDSFGVKHIPKEIRKFIGNKILQKTFMIPHNVWILLY